MSASHEIPSHFPLPSYSSPDALRAHLQSHFPPPSNSAPGTSPSTDTPGPSSPNPSTDSTTVDGDQASPIISDTKTRTATPAPTQAPTRVQTAAPRAALMPIPAKAGVAKTIVRGVGNWWLDPLAVYAEWFGITPSRGEGVRSGLEAVPRHV